jgi:LEA14-like dessication related protein
MKTRILSLAAAVIVLLAACRSSNVKEPEYRNIQNIRLVDAGVLQTTAGIDLRYYNPNNFGVQLNDAYGDVYINNFYLGRFSLGQKVNVGKRSEFIVPALIKLDMIGAVKNQRDLWKKKEALVRIEGSANIKRSGLSFNVPIKHEGMENIERLRSLIEIK